jgi:hypothetical protein
VNDRPQTLTPSSEREMLPRLPAIFDDLDIPERTPLDGRSWTRDAPIYSNSRWIPRSGNPDPMERHRPNGYAAGNVAAIPP